ncbi:cysteine---tRNA ligase [Spizellomyces sp. 'palustris']|nr:cysteine---tRNA ligase [Spizellomyces sp. 'palustris']
MSNGIKQPEWAKPQGTPVPRLRILNSMTKSKEEFIPISGNRVGWYCCGPTVYDKSHMGHARAYITFDILRRILEDYFGYNVFYVMNITDVDDKIIREARYKYLFESLKAETNALTADLIGTVEAAWGAYVTSKFKTHAPRSIDEFGAFLEKYKNGGIAEATEEAKFDLFVKTATRTVQALASAKTSLASGSTGKDAADHLLDASRDVVASWIDSKHGHTVTDPKVFREFAAYWEDEYFKDMDALNIRRPDVLTRVSEYVPEIVLYIEKIIQNGYAYEADGSVYFDTVRFDNAPNHNYAKLEPWSAGNTKLLQEGEGDLTGEAKGKKNPADFALWKKSKAGEPAWPSPWGAGRPGWHIECSVMASDVLGEQLDIHTGGIDLAFPHHDNEMAQSEGYYDCRQWVNYFIHAGHLHIEGQKMSKSLKNFVTIQEALTQYTASQIRLMFLLHQWNAVLDFGSGSLMEAKTVETAIQNFLANVKAVVMEQQSSVQPFTGAHQYRDAEKELMEKFRTKQQLIHLALLDSFNTPTVISELRDLISISNAYYTDATKNKSVNADVLAKIAKYVTHLLRMFGVFGDGNPDIGNGVRKEETNMLPYLVALSAFRDAVRDLAQNRGDYKDLLRLCDKLRDEDMVELGVVLDDREDGKALVKLVDKETLIRQREEKRQREHEKALEKSARLALAQTKRAEKLLKGKTPPSELFRTPEYSEWDEKGVPTKDKDGEVLSKSRRKKCEKEWGVQSKLHEEYLASLKE